ncbi:MAG TPA: GDSL family lipase, partial [Lachnospiraceae bacterium]|nr:GDSL family lipase [Lachnospiraceae bacterium]
EITAPPEASLTIEFVGDSITSGEGSCGAQMEEDWISPYFGVENNYARMT